MGIFNSNEFTIGIPSKELSNAIGGILDLLNSDPVLKLNLSEEAKDIIFGERIFFSFDGGILRIFITDGFRALIYTVSCTGPKTVVSFSISREELAKINTLIEGETVNLQLKDSTPTFISQNKKLILASYKESKDFYTPLKTAINQKVVAEATVKGSDLQHHSSLFGQKEIFSLTIDTDNNLLKFTRSVTNYEDSIPASINGCTTERNISPKFLFPFVTSLKSKDVVQILFHDTFLIEIKIPGRDAMSYLLMPILKK